MSKIECPGNEV